MDPRVDTFLDRAARWQEEMEKLRLILLDCHLTEEFKWGKPCYTYQHSNVIIIQDFKEYCALLFIKGSLLKDENKLLIRQTENVQAARQIRFTEIKQIAGLGSILKAYVCEAIEVEKAGLKVSLKKTSEYAIPEEFQQRLDASPGLKTAYEALTPGRQRAYLMHFSQPKQGKTRESRIEKCIPKILIGKGLNE
ncbi:MAG: YdeI/OmpD-associated family protein [Bacteroidales bacterium]|nr:YdeI/OmpD-associated family protein [Bacteroidales bacterium]